MNGLYNNLGLVLGPAIAGVLISAIGFAVTYGVSLLSGWAMRVCHQGRRTLWLALLLLGIAGAADHCIVGTLVVAAMFPILLRYDASARA